MRLSNFSNKFPQQFIYTQIHEVVFPIVPATQQRRGFAFVEYTSEDSVKEATKKTNQVIDVEDDKVSIMLKMSLTWSISSHTKCCETPVVIPVKFKGTIWFLHKL